MTRPIRVLVADDHAMIREGVRHVLMDADDLDVVADVGGGRAALEAIGRDRPDVVLLDLTMPDVDGLEVLESAREVSPDTRFVVLSMHGDHDSVANALAAGATGYLLKDEAGPGELREAVRAAMAGRPFFTVGIAEMLAEPLQPGRGGGTADRLEELTARERQVLKGIAEGLSNKQVAALLGIGRRTVESHRESLIRKLEIRSVAGLTRFAIEVGLVRVEPPETTSPA